MCKAVVFDLDDTLYPEKQFVFSGFRAVEEWLGKNGNVAGFFEIAAELFNTGARGNIFDLALAHLGITTKPGLIGELLKVYREHAPLISLYADADQALKTLRAEFRLGLITDGYLATQRNKVKSLQIEPFFEAIIYTDFLGREFWKPHVKAFEQLCETFGCRGTDCVYIADNPQKDFIAPRKLGWKTIRVRRAEGEHCKICPGPNDEADIEVSNLANILDVL